ncbi:hypothetical protein KQX54_002123 [Cotesia glomerata]|uniref:Uncharacterized protein n=1 Tax=Cotesia glomerata TaxID=32391 RepID=A0AAV7HZS4_COTGL|nr:hypothetical protein KQX54_002123 [Cotesia glomerata]
MPPSTRGCGFEPLILVPHVRKRPRTSKVLQGRKRGRNREGSGVYSRVPWAKVESRSSGLQITETNLDPYTLVTGCHPHSPTLHSTFCTSGLHCLIFDNKKYHHERRERFKQSFETQRRFKSHLESAFSGICSRIFLVGRFNGTDIEKFLNIRSRKSDVDVLDLEVVSDCNDYQYT